jgi:penicillin V acylase-like amidase (Ntn superfamily)
VAQAPFAGQVHLALSDASGDSTILEYVGGELVVHRGREFQVMTSSQTFDRQLAIAACWEEIGGAAMLPGANIRNASVPMGISTPDKPNISSTRWRTVADHRQGRHFFEAVTSPNVVWVTPWRHGRRVHGRRAVRAAGRRPGCGLTAATRRARRRDTPSSAPTGTV